MCNAQIEICRGGVRIFIFKTAPKVNKYSHIQEFLACRVLRCQPLSNTNSDLDFQRG